MTRGPVPQPRPGPNAAPGTSRPAAWPRTSAAGDDDTVVLPPVDDRPTLVTSGPLLPRSPDPDASPPAAAGVPEVPALADLAGPGRPPVDMVAGLTPGDDGVTAGSRPREVRPSRSMRARADEMARLLERAAPRAGSRRRLSSLPAAVAVAGAFAVGGVGLALGLDAQRTGQQLALPPMPALPAEGVPAVPGEPGSGPRSTDALAPAPPATVGPAAGVVRDVPPVRTAAPRAPARTAPAPRDVAAPGTTPDVTPTTTRTSRTPRSTTSAEPTSPRSTGAGAVPRRSGARGASGA